MRTVERLTAHQLFASADREQSRVRADVESERQHGDGREAGIPGDLAGAVPQIVCELVNQEAAVSLTRQ